MEMTVLLIVCMFVAFCNGVMVGMVAKDCDNYDKSFAEAWNEMVHESQDKKLGKVCMKTFYFIPQIIATVSKIRPAYQK